MTFKKVQDFIEIGCLDLLLTNVSCLNLFELEFHSQDNSGEPHSAARGPKQVCIVSSTELHQSRCRYEDFHTQHMVRKRSFHMVVLSMNIRSYCSPDRNKFGARRNGQKPALRNENIQQIFQ